MMRKVEGYVFIAETEVINIMVGKRINSEIDIDAEVLERNGIVPYNSLEEAKNGSIEFKEKRIGVKSVKLGKLEMEIAENPDEVSSFEDKDSLIVIGKYDDGGAMFVGEYVESAPSALPGSYLDRNGFKPFTSSSELWTVCELAKHVAREIGRKGSMYTTIATFSLEFIQ